jgi:2-dehydro-3-deoxyphosphogluconate aldolase/(4S)-4-hydroxy-2-oxoglutarate aldolase
MESQFPQEMLDRIERVGVIAVLVVDDAAHAVPVAEALLAGGIDVIELTLRTPAAIDALQRIRDSVPQMLAGIGTVITTGQVDQIVDTGAAFGVAPGLNRRVVERAKSLGLPFAPGIMTPSELEAAVELGCRELKFFPAEPSGGMKLLTSMQAPYAHLGLRFIPLGGINSQNLAGYIGDPAVIAVGGSWIATRKLIQAEDWDAITNNAAEARRIVDRVRSGDGGKA